MQLPKRRRNWEGLRYTFRLRFWVGTKVPGTGQVVDSRCASCFRWVESGQVSGTPLHSFITHALHPRYTHYSCVAFICMHSSLIRRTLHPASHSYTIYALRSSTFHASHSFPIPARTRSLFMHHIHKSFMRCTFMYQPCSLEPPWSFILLDMYQVPDFVARVLRYGQM